MIYLFIGMLLTGANGRLFLLAHRGGFFAAHESQKSFALVLFEFFGFLLGIAAFIISFLLFDWWIPLAALAVGYWLVAPAIVTRNSFAFMWQIKELLTVGAITCSTMLLNRYFDFF